MRIVTRAQLMEEEPGVIFREFGPMVFDGEWQRFLGVLGDDFVSGAVGPILEGPNEEYPNGAVTIQTENTSRDGAFEFGAKYIVLDAVDVEAFIKSLRGEDVDMVYEIPTLAWESYEPGGG